MDHVTQRPALLTRQTLTDWIDRYERAWRAPGTDALADLFAADAIYRPAPFDDPCAGLRAIATLWEAEREGPDEVFALTYEIVAIERDTGVARLEVTYGDPPARRYRDLWVVALGADGRCTSFEEWPFFPDQARVAPAPGA